MIQQLELVWSLSGASLLAVGPGAGHQVITVPSFCAAPILFRSSRSASLLFLSLVSRLTPNNKYVAVEGIAAARLVLKQPYQLDRQHRIHRHNTAVTLLLPEQTTPVPASPCKLQATARPRPDLDLLHAQAAVPCAPSRVFVRMNTCS
ncbi:hypothetical protein F4808DRAFT_99285 [Astrocystis sublimbata]|nr:hypothetical protein F4808DRAFT_99285 [Astrocystis sublimbata]